MSGIAVDRSVPNAQIYHLWRTRLFYSSSGAPLFKCGRSRQLLGLTASWAERPNIARRTLAKVRTTQSSNEP